MFQEWMIGQLLLQISSCSTRNFTNTGAHRFTRGIAGIMSYTSGPVKDEITYDEDFQLFEYQSRFGFEMFELTEGTVPLYTCFHKSITSL